MSKPAYKIEKIDNITRSRKITIEHLIESFKATVGAPEEATVLFEFPVTQRGRTVEVIWSEKDPSSKSEFETAKEEIDHLIEKIDMNFEGKVRKPVEPEARTYPVATGGVQVGDLVMVRDYDSESWMGPTILTQIIDIGRGPYATIVATWKQARCLNDKERAQIKRI